MRVNVQEAYHYGDLDKAAKAESKSNFMGGNRNTGAFGTGFYCVSTLDPKGYRGRDIWEIDLDKYNCYKPKSNNDAHELHSALMTLNNLTAYVSDVCLINDSWWKKSRSQLIDELYEMEDEGDEAILDFIKKYDPNLMFVDKWDVQDAVKEERWGRLERIAKEFIEDLDDLRIDVGSCVNRLSRYFNGNMYSTIMDLLREYKDYTGEDTLSTLFMKELGYEGIDVTHLNKDADGLSGLDNFAFGSVVYDLKPGTYRKVQ